MNNLIMHDPDLLDVLIKCFFEERKQSKEHPTLPGLALFVGFNRTADITQTLEKWADENSSYPERAVQGLIRAITMIEDYFLQRGLDAKIPAALTKFCLGAYHQVKEPAANQGIGEVNAVQIVFEAAEDRTPKFVSTQDVKQLQGSQKSITSKDITIEMPA